MSEKHFLNEYPRIFPLVYRYVRSRIPHAQTSEDIVSEIFLKAWKQRHRFNPEKGNIEQWLITIAKHQIIDYWRAQQITINIDDVVHQLTDTANTATQDDIDFELRIQALPEETQALLRLRFVDGLTHNQIAQRIHKSPTAVRSLFSRLLNTLRLQWKHYE